MNIVKCDICKKVIKGNPITVGEGYFPRFEFCSDCARPILEVMENNKLIDSKKKKSKS
jgi:hypothetical protein